MALEVQLEKDISWLELGVDGRKKTVHRLTSAPRKAGIETEVRVGNGRAPVSNRGSA